LRHVTVDEEWAVRQSGGEARIGTGRLLIGVVDRRQLGVRRAIAVDLARGGTCFGKAVGAREVTEQIVETVILQIDDNDMLNLVEPCRTATGRLRRGGKG